VYLGPHFELYLALWKSLTLSTAYLQYDTIEPHPGCSLVLAKPAEIRKGVD